MFDSNDLADNRPFLVEIAGISGLHSNSSVRASALRVEEEETGASAHRLTVEEGKPGASALRLMGAKGGNLSATYKDLIYRSVANLSFRDAPDCSETPSVVSCNQPLFDRLADIVSRLCHHLDFNLDRPSLPSLAEPNGTINGVVAEQKKESSDFRELQALIERLPSLILNSRSKIGIASSGTTGKPKWVHHRMDTLARSVIISPNHRDDVWGLAYSPDRFAGLQVFLQAICNLNTIVSLLGLPPDEIHAAIETYSITRLSATPTWFRLLVNGTMKHETVRSITVGGEVCHPSLMTEMQRVFPNAKFHNIYASTEAGSLFHSDADAFIVTEDRKGLLRVEDGQLWLHETLIAESLRGNCVDAFFPTGDEVEIVRESPWTLRVLARRSDWINVGGVKVNPHAVEDALLQIVGIREARVFAQKNSVVGNLVCAEIVLDKEVQYTVTDIRRILSSQLDNYSIPRIIQFVDKIGISPSGKKGRTV